MGWVRHPDGVTPDLLRSARFEIEIAGTRYPAEASLRAFYDPDGIRMRLSERQAGPTGSYPERLPLDSHGGGAQVRAAGREPRWKRS